MPVFQHKTHQIAKERLASYLRSAPINVDNVFENQEEKDQNPFVQEPEETSRLSLKNKSKNRSRISGNLLDGSDIMSAPIISRTWKVPSNLASGNSGRLRFTTVNHGFMKDSN